MEPTFAWSNSRAKLLNDCAYKYFLNYYASWNGWLKNAPEETKKLYLLKQMTNWPMHLGTIVHSIIENVINNYKNTGKIQSLAESERLTIELLNKAYKESKSKEWLTDPKNKINLFEDYYGKKPSKEKLLEYRTKALSCVGSFYKSKLLETIKKLSPRDILPLEQFQQFETKTGEKISVKIDFAFKYNGKLYITDWKTGKVVDDTISQLVSYAMYALKIGWAKKLEDIVIIPAYLALFGSEGDDSFPHTLIDMLAVKNQLKVIQVEYKKLDEAHENRNNKDFFKMTDNIRSCSYCNFKEICPGSKRC